MSTVTTDSPMLTHGPVRLHPGRWRAWAHGQELKLTPTEFRILRALLLDPHRVRTKDELLRHIWGPSRTRARTLDSHAQRLRMVLRGAGVQNVIINVWGVGYRYADEPA